MPKVIITDAGEKYQRFLVECPACRCSHSFNSSWEFNGDIENPTFHPSLLVRWGDEENPKRICHSYIKNGKWEFLSDCTHKLAGKTVDMVDIEI